MVTLQCTHHDLSVNNGNAVPVELMDADAVMNELMDALHTFNNFPVTEDSAHRSRSHIRSRILRRLAVTAKESIIGQKRFANGPCWNLNLRFPPCTRAK